MRLNRILIIAVAAVILLGGAFYLLKDRIGDNTENNTQSSYEKIVDFKSDNVKKITIEKDTLKYIIEKNENAWVLTYPQDIKTDSSKVSSMALYSYSIGSSKVIVEEGETEDLSIYGFNNPGTITIEPIEGDVATLEIGNKTPTGSYYYVKLKGSSKVYAMDSYTGDKIFVDKNELLDKLLHEVLQEDIVFISMERNGQKLFDAERTDEYNWVMTYPIEAGVDSTAAVSITQAVASINAESILDDISGLEAYGLDKPSYSFVIRTKGNETTRLNLGKEEGNSIYAMIEGRKEVFTLPLSTFSFADKPLKEIVEIFAYIVNIQDVSGIKVEIDGKIFDITIETDPDDKDKDKFTINGKDASMKDEGGDQPFRSLYQALIGITLSEVEPAGNPQQNAEITFTYTLKAEPYLMKVEYVSMDEMYYYVVKNGKYSGIIVEKSKFDRAEGVREEIKKMEEFINNYNK